MDKRVKMLLQAVRRRVKAFPFLNRRKDLIASLDRALTEEDPNFTSELDEATREALTCLLNNVYRAVWNANVTLPIATQSYYKSYLDDPSVPEEVREVMNALSKGEMTTEKASELLEKTIKDYELGIMKLGYTFDDEIDAYLETSHYKEKRRKIPPF